MWNVVSSVNEMSYKKFGFTLNIRSANYTLLSFHAIVGSCMLEALISCAELCEFQAPNCIKELIYWAANAWLLYFCIFF
jgi:hypothetical protein